MPRLPQLFAARERAPVLPDDGRMRGDAGRGIPQEAGLALVRDADRIDLRGSDAGLGEHLLRHRQLRAPDLACVVLDPARVGKDLPELLLRDGDRLAGPVEQNGA